MGLELLAPARNADQGILALRCGADAVYMGGTKFGARQAAGNTAQDFERLTSEARLWDAKVYATINTLLFDAELEEARRLAWSLYEAGVDALIIQDMGLLELDLPPLPLHASTQAVCDSPEKVAFLASAGFSRAILAREMSVADIRTIHAAADIELEAFVFGALCVGESGRCYLSGAVCGRSGNRGECAQPCRATWDLLDGKGRVLIRDQHLLSIHDLDLSDHLEALADAGVTSFKIEGRLKDADYIKNVVSHLRRRLDALLASRPDYAASSLGRVTHGFLPEPAKTFNRGLSTYRVDGARRPMGTPASAGHVGEYVGTVRSVRGQRIELEQEAPLNPGDGLVFLEGGTLVNAVEGRQVVLQDAAGLKPGVRLHRNLDHRWLKALRSAKLERRIPVRAVLDFPPDQVRLRITDPSGLHAEVRQAGECPPGVGSTEALREALSRLGGTPFCLEDLQIDEARFIPISRLNALRREAAAELEALRRAPRARPPRRAAGSPNPVPATALDFSWNVANERARAFYARAGATAIEAAAECQASLEGRVVMTTRHCLRYELGWCPSHPNASPALRAAEAPGPLFLENGATRLECRFDCANCKMELILRERPPRKPRANRP